MFRDALVPRHHFVLWVFLVVGTLATLCPSVSKADPWVPVYSEDFSSDPGWTTNDPSNNQWDGTQGAYHVRMWDAGNQYAYVNVPISSPSGSLRLDFDVKVMGMGWAGNVRLGLGDADMTLFSPASIWADYGNQDWGGNIIGDAYWDSTGGSFAGFDDYLGQFAIGTGYRNSIIYDSGAHTLTLTVRRVDDNVLVGTKTRTNVGQFDGLDRIVSTSIGDSYAPGATGEALIDNVTLYVPEPGSFALVAIVGLGLLARRRLGR